MSPMIFIFTYKKLNNTYRDVVIDPSKTEEFTPACREYFIDDLTGTSLAWRRAQPVIHTHMRVWDIENEGWRTLVKNRIIYTVDEDSDEDMFGEDEEDQMCDCDTGECCRWCCNDE